MLWPRVSVFGQLTYEPYAFVTVAGKAQSGSRDGVGEVARFDTIRALMIDGAGNLYAADGSYKPRVRKITPDGVVSTIAGGLVRGNEDGFGRGATFQGISDLSSGGDGSIYVMDNLTVRKIAPSGQVTTLFGIVPKGRWGDALAVDSATNVYYFNDGAVTKRTVEGVTVKIAAEPPDFYVSDLVLDSGGSLFIASPQAIYKLPPAGVLSVFAGRPGVLGLVDGVGTNALFYSASVMTIDWTDNLYVVERASILLGGGTVRKITPDGTVSPAFMIACGREVCGAYGGSPRAIAVDRSGNLFAGAKGNTIDKVTREGDLSVFVGSAGGSGNTDGVGEAARFGGWAPDRYPGRLENEPIGIHGVTLDFSGNAYSTDLNGVRKITQGREVTTISTEARSGFGWGAGIAFLDGNIYVSQLSRIVKIDKAGVLSVILTGLLTLDGGGLPGIVADKATNLYVLGGHQSVVKVSPGQPDWKAGALSVRDQSGRSSTNFGAFLSAIAIDSEGHLIVADDSAVRKLTPSGTNWILTTIAGSITEAGARDGVGSEARFHTPLYGLALDRGGNIYVSDTGNNLIRKVTVTGAVTTLAGSLDRGSDDGIGAAAGFYGPRGIAVDDGGNVYVGDYGNHTFRKGFPAGRIDSAGVEYKEGEFRFKADGPAGIVAVVETSTDLVGWRAFSTNAVGGVTNVIDAKAKGSRGFYRLSFPP